MYKHVNKQRVIKTFGIKTCKTIKVWVRDMNQISEGKKTYGHISII